MIDREAFLAAYRAARAELESLNRAVPATRVIHRNFEDAMREVSVLAGVSQERLRELTDQFREKARRDGEKARSEGHHQAAQEDQVGRDPE